MDGEKGKFFWISYYRSENPALKNIYNGIFSKYTGETMGGERKTRTVHINLTDEDVTVLNTLCAKYGVSAADVTAFALRHMLRKKPNIISAPKETHVLKTKPKFTTSAKRETQEAEE